jgi:YjbE family integral membrane protein
MMLDFIIRALKIVLIDVLLAGDNAVVIAMAVRSLPSPQRRTATLAGAGFAIVLRIGLTFFAAEMLNLPFFKLIGGLLILWIALKLLTDVDADPDDAPQAHNIRHAIWVILVADITMSLDNIWAVAAASGGSLILLIVGLALSISFVMFMSGFLARLMGRYPIILYGGGAILGQVAGDMIAHDPWVSRGVNIPAYGIEAGLAVLVLLVGWIIRTKKRKKPATAGVS